MYPLFVTTFILGAWLSHSVARKSRIRPERLWTELAHEIKYHRYNVNYSTQITLLVSIVMPRCTLEVIPLACVHASLWRAILKRQNKKQHQHEVWLMNEWVNEWYTQPCVLCYCNLILCGRGKETTIISSTWRTELSFSLFLGVAIESVHVYERFDKHRHMLWIGMLYSLGLQRWVQREQKEKKLSFLKALSMFHSGYPHFMNVIFGVIQVVSGI